MRNTGSSDLTFVPRQQGSFVARRSGPWLVALATLLLPVPVVGQGQTVSVSIPSAGAMMRGTVHVGEGPAPRATVLLFPGLASRGEEVLGLGAALSAAGMNVVMFAPRGWHDSGGTFTFTGAIDDGQAAFDWLHGEEVVHRFGVDIQRVSVGGYSFGASTVLAFAAQEPRVRRLFSIAPTDHYEMALRVREDDAYRTEVHTVMAPLFAESGPIRVEWIGEDPTDLTEFWREWVDDRERFWLPALAPGLRDLSLFLISGLDDANALIPQLEGMHLPLYRALRELGATDVRFRLFEDGHAFSSSRAELVEALLDWLQGWE